MNLRRAILTGLGVWAIPFAISLVIFPWRANRALFESVMAVSLTVVAVGFSRGYFQKPVGVGISVGLGIVWMAVAMLLDIVVLVYGFKAMTLSGYVTDIGLTYLMLPVITFGVGSARRS
jgi:hypothetical protein